MKKLLFLVMLLSSMIALTQNVPLIENTTHGITGTLLGHITHGDVNNDGNEDIFITGYTYLDNETDTSLTQLLLGNGNGGFTIVPTPFPNLGLGSYVELVDINNDGNLDAYVSGYVGNINGQDVIFAATYLGDGNGGFGTEPHQMLTGLYWNHATFADLDGDGNLDMIRTGENANGVIRTMVYRNDNGIFTEMATTLDNVFDASVAIFDVDNDGVNDVIIIGSKGNEIIAKIYKNNGNFLFSVVPNNPFTPSGTSSMDVADINNDGYLDLVIMGTTMGPNIFNTYINNGNGTFSLFQTFTGMSSGQVVFGDMNNDGFPDMFAVGASRSWHYADLYLNDGAGNMTFERTFDPGYEMASATLTDINNDGYLDILYSGTEGIFNAIGEMSVWMSQIPIACNAPTNIVISNIDENSADISWSPGGNEAQWNVSYGLAGFDPNTNGTTVLVGTTSTTITNLSPNTGYDVYVRSVCGSNDVSDWTGPVNFATGTVSVGDHDFVNFVYYPNPLGDVLNLRAGLPIQNIQVYTMLGQNVLGIQPDRLEVQISTEELSSGMYVMNVTINGSYKTFRVVKK